MDDTSGAPSLVTSRTADGVVTITLDSPANRNALSRRLITELTRAVTELTRPETVRAAVLTHTGPVFCSGADLSETSADGVRSGLRDLLFLFRELLTRPVPIVARVDGAVRAGGLGLLGACDIVVASTRSSFAFSEVRLGLAPAIIELPLRERLSSRARSRYFVTGETFDAAVAARIGLITEAADDADAALAPILAALRLGSRQGLRESKRLAAAPLLRALDEDGDAMTELSAALFASEPAQEQMRSFLHRR